MSKGKELWRVVKLFLLNSLIGGVITGFAIIPMLFRGLSMHKSRGAIIKGIFESDYFWLSECTAYLLVIIIFINNRYVKMSLGRMARMNRSTLWTAIAVAVMIAGSYIISNISFWELIGLDESYFPEDIEKMESMYGPMSKCIPGVIAGVILAPIAEEILYRGILLRGMLKMRWYPWIAIPMSALLFSIMHGTTYQTIDIFPFGIIVGWLYWRTKSLYPGIFMHIVNNAIAFGFMQLPESSDDDTEEVSMIVFIIMFAISIALIAYGINWYRKKTQPQYKGISLGESQNYPKE